MHLRSVTIKNFRALANVTVELDETTVLISENNTGKTSFLEALKLCLAQGASRRGDLFDDYDHRLGENMTLEAFLQEMDLAPKVPPPPSNATRCLTIHSSKGVEFDHVYLVGLVEDLLPSFQAVKKGPQSREIQEERRNCFVAITRAVESLTLTYAQRYSGWNKEPSRFLYEMGLLADDE